MTVTAPDYSARILGTPPIPVAMRGDAGSISFDSGRAPHVEARGIRLALPDPELLDDLDPRDNRRVEISAGGRVFDLGLREASPDRASGTVVVELASDEALLDDFAQLDDDKAPRALAPSLRSVVDYTLGKIGGHLEASALDADVTPYWGITNLIPNPSVEVTGGLWTAGTGASALQRIVMAAPVAPAGTAALRFTAAAGDANVIAATATVDYAVRPGQWYVFSFYICSGVARTAGAVIQWWSSNGSVLSSQSFGATITTASSQFRRATVTAQAPAGASHAYPYVRTQGNAAGNLHYVDCAMFHEGDEVVPYFDGASPADPHYTYAWQADAHRSTSTRVPVIERPPAALTWPAGVSGLQFLHPLIQAAGYRLVCNERRKWTLRDTAFRDPGAQTFRDGVNIITADERISRDSEEWCDAAVFDYTWKDDDGIEQSRIDAWAITPTPTKVIRREINAPYPGPGRAQYAVTRAQGKGRTVTATKQATWTESADQTFSAILEGTPIQIGTAESVVFDMATNRVTTTSRTTDTPAGAIVLLPGTIYALTGTINNL